MTTRVWTWLRSRLAAAGRGDDGFNIVGEAAAMLALSVTVLVFLWAGVQTLGTEILDWIRAELGVGGIGG